jgi:3-hydroxyisobutyrate dehydrogenase
MNVAVLGTGTMGAGIARNLVRAGHSVSVWNRTRTKAEGLGATVADSPAEAVAAADVLITMLSDGPVVDAVIRDAVRSVREGTVWAQLSTVGVVWTERLASLAGEHGLGFVDAPVMGSRPQADEGQLLPLASGDERSRTILEPLFAAFSREVIWLGDEPGLGSRLKLAANHWLLVTVENLAETLALTEALGVEPRRFFELISGASFDMTYAHWKGELMLKGEFPSAFSIRLARKDVGLALEAGDAVGIELALARATFDRFGRAVDAGYGDQDSAVTYLVARRGNPA